MAAKKIYRPSGAGFYEVTNDEPDLLTPVEDKSKQAYVYDFTYFINPTLQSACETDQDAKIDFADIEEYLKTFCKAYCFQLEETPTTKRWHLQGRFKTQKITRIQTLVNKFQKDSCPFYPCHLSYTSRLNHQAPAFYRYPMKGTTRVPGYEPIADMVFEDENPQQLDILEDVHELNAWQKYVYEERITKYRDKDMRRKITWIHCSHGNTGKTTFKSWLRFNKHAQIIPNCENYQMIMQCVLQLETRPCYVIDIPRAAQYNKSTMRGIYSAIETIKDGYAYDTRFRLREKHMKSQPMVVVMSNFLPDPTALSIDRWHIISLVKKDKEVVYKDITKSFLIGIEEKKSEKSPKRRIKVIED